MFIDEDDLSDVMEEVLPIRSLYYDLGRSLKLRVTDLDTIQKKYPSQSDADCKKALQDVLLLWLNKNYKVERFGEPSWRMLVKAVNMESGGNNTELAKKIATNHPAGYHQECDKIIAL